MKRSGFCLVLALIMAFVATGCCLLVLGAEAGWYRIDGSGVVVTEERPVSGINAVNLGTIGQLHIEIGDKESLTIEAEDNLLEYLETEVRGGLLTITETKGLNLKPRERVDYFLTVKALNHIEVSSAGDVEVSDLHADQFTIFVSSAGDLEMGALECERLNVHLSSAGDVDIEELNAQSVDVTINSAGDLSIKSGRVIEQNITLSSAGDYEAENLESTKARIEVNSTGDATVRVRDYLDVRTSSVGSIYYHGNPEVDQSVGSLGRIRRLGESRKRQSHFASFVVQNDNNRSISPKKESSLLCAVS